MTKMPRSALAAYLALAENARELRRRVSGLRRPLLAETFSDPLAARCAHRSGCPP